MIALIAAAGPALPLGKAGKFVAAAYIVFVVLILVYVAIMAVRAQRVERELHQLQLDVEFARARSGTAPGARVPAPDRPAGERLSPAYEEKPAQQRGESGSLL